MGVSKKHKQLLRGLQRYQGGSPNRIPNTGSKTLGHNDKGSFFLLGCRPIDIKPLICGLKLGDQVLAPSQKGVLLCAVLQVFWTFSLLRDQACQKEAAGGGSV